MKNRDSISKALIGSKKEKEKKEWWSPAWLGDRKTNEKFSSSSTEGEQDTTAFPAS